MINEIISIGNEIEEFELILGQLTWYEVPIWCTLNYRIPYQEIWIVGDEEFPDAFGPCYFDDKQTCELSVDITTLWVLIVKPGRSYLIICPLNFQLL